MTPPRVPSLNIYGKERRWKCQPEMAGVFGGAPFAPGQQNITYAVRSYTAHPPHGYPPGSNANLVVLRNDAARILQLARTRIGTPGAEQIIRGAQTLARLVGKLAKLRARGEQ